MFSESHLVLWSPCFGRGSWLLCFSLICACELAVLLSVLFFLVSLVGCGLGLRLFLYIFINSFRYTVKSQWLENLREHGYLFQTWVVRATDGKSSYKVKKQILDLEIISLFYHYYNYYYFFFFFFFFAFLQHSNCMLCVLIRIASSSTTYNFMIKWENFP